VKRYDDPTVLSTVAVADERLGVDIVASRYASR
jgi:hypothetical protein